MSYAIAPDDVAAPVDRDERGTAMPACDAPELVLAPVGIGSEVALVAGLVRRAGMHVGHGFRVLGPGEADDDLRAIVEVLHPAEASGARWSARHGVDEAE